MNYNSNLFQQINYKMNIKNNSNLSTDKLSAEIKRLKKEIKYKKKYG